MRNKQKQPGSFHFRLREDEQAEHPHGGAGGRPWTCSLTWIKHHISPGTSSTWGPVMLLNSRWRRGTFLSFAASCLKSDVTTARTAPFLPRVPWHFCWWMINMTFLKPQRGTRQKQATTPPPKKSPKEANSEEVKRDWCRNRWDYFALSNFWQDDFFWNTRVTCNYLTHIQSTANLPAWWRFILGWCRTGVCYRTVPYRPPFNADINLCKMRKILVFCLWTPSSLWRNKPTALNPNTETSNG